MKQHFNIRVHADSETTSIVSTPADVLTDVLMGGTADHTDLVSPPRKVQKNSVATDGTFEVIDLVSPEPAVHKKQRVDTQAAEAESSSDENETESQWSEAEVKGLLREIEVLKKEKRSELGLYMHVVLAGVRLGKCVASMCFEWEGNLYTLLALSGWATRNATFTDVFITPPIAEIMRVAGELGCLNRHCNDHGLFGRYYCSHAERQLFMKWRNITDERGTVFSCGTTIAVCGDCAVFFKQAAKRYGITVSINNKRYT